jgi:hypothetical protein
MINRRPAFAGRLSLKGQANAMRFYYNSIDQSSQRHA